MKNPKISVIIPLYNHEKYIQEAVHSVLEQTISDFELIIINDGSSDRSEEVATSIQDKRIRYFAQENRGAPNTINRGIELAKGEYISILNSDDVYYPTRFEEFLKIPEGDNSISAVFSHIAFIDGQGKFIRHKKGAEDNWIDKKPETSFKGENNIILDLLAGNFLITTSNLFCRKNVFQDIGLFQNLKYAHDYEFFLRLCYHFKVHIVDKPLFKYRIHSENTYGIENKAEADFEVGLVLSNFFLNYDLKKILPDNDIYTNVAKFFNSINTFHSEKMVLTLVVFALNFKIHTEILKDLTENSESLFRKTSIDYLKNYLDVWKESQEVWKESQEAWKQWQEAEDKATKWWKHSKKSLRKLEETSQRLIKTNKKLSDMTEEANKWRLSSADALEKLEETNFRLIDVDKKVSETNERLIEITQQMQSLLNSLSYRLGRFLTWPMRKLLNK